MPRSLVLLALVLAGGLVLPAAASARALTLSVSADVARVAPRAPNGYTVVVSNPNAHRVTLTRLLLHLPDHGHGGDGASPDSTAAGESGTPRTPFEYVPGSTTGFTTADPRIRNEGLDLIWRGAFPVPAQGSISLHVRVLVSGMVATYFASAYGWADGVRVLEARHVAPITVEQTGDVRLTVAADVGRVCTGGTVRYTLTVTNAGATTLTFASVRNGLPRDFSYVPGSTSGLTSADPRISTSGAILRYDGPFHVAAHGSATLRFTARAGNATGTQSDRARLEGLPDGSVVGTGPTAPVRVVTC